MEKSNKICKYQLETSIKPILIYYSILIGFLLLILIEKFMSQNSNVRSSGIEMSTAIFIFIMALNSFKSPFYFSQGNNISRNSFIIGTIKAGIIMAAALSLIDVIINRIYNIFIICPTNFDMIYTKAIYGIDTGWEPILTHSISNSFGTYIWTFTVYVFLFMLGLLITIIYFRLNKLGQIVLSFFPVILIVVTSGFYSYIPTGVWDFIENAFGINTKNPYIAIITFIILSILAIAGQYLLIKKAVTDKN
ncbi:hypothetical protein [Clostridium botulinum]|uniref:ABC transporter permease n=1 Tax=Clostridium botulinum TaxID=1491 RepID=A0ABD7CPS0_CLOBO|nr:hypothetical protein [Clostridium botulinum]KGO12924.1 membrane protein [Clostridium botulinum]KIN80521.1 membrane protein [Clostridium botulinum]MCC5428375.1 hypothetical protein [Clostridium botulinum]QRI54764.1 hypothetical protein JQS73_06590 [Clostridium botulinum]